MTKKRPIANTEDGQPAKFVNTHKPSVAHKCGAGVKYTVSVALPGSIISNAQNLELKTLLAGQIARALSIFCVTEIVIFDESAGRKCNTVYTSPSPDEFLAHILSYLETPQYLRKILFPIHPNLRYAGLLPPLDTPPHAKMDANIPFREGVVLENTENDESIIEAGLGETLCINELVAPHSRITLEFKLAKRKGHGLGKAKKVDANKPRYEQGYYWGYNVRMASSISAVFTESTYIGGYDYTIGTSERGQPLNDESIETIPTFKHLLIVFGGVAGIEAAINEDPVIGLAASEASQLFDQWINICPNQGSRTIRTEESLLVGLAIFQRIIERKSE